MGNGRVVIALLVLALVMLALPGGASPLQEDDDPIFGPPVLPRRLAGPDRVATSAAIADWAYPVGARRAYLAHRDRGFAAALAAGAMPDGPTLLVPGGDDPPHAVVEVIERLDPHTIVALGDDGEVTAAMLHAVADGRATDRIAGPDPVTTAASLARQGFAGGADVVHLAQSVVLTDGMAAGILAGGPILLVPADGEVPWAVHDAIGALDPAQVVALGGAGAISDAVLDEVADGRPTGRLAGGSRFETAAAIARHAFPGIADLVYLARHDVLADAIVGGSLPDGPILLVESCTPDLHPSTAAELRRLRPEGVIALGGPAAVCDAVLDAADAVARS